jgi:flagellar assembly factor FliW
MPQISSQRFGPLELDSNAVLEFPAGLPGFEGQTRFLLVEDRATAPIVFLQSCSASELCFLAAPLAAIDDAYQLAITPEDLHRLGLDENRQPRMNEELLCLAILSAPEDGPLTANLLAPAVINLVNRKAVQAVRADSRYSHRHPLAPREAPCS